MTHARQIGFAIQEKTKDNHSVRQQIIDALGIREIDLEKIYTGRMILTGQDLKKIAKICNVPVSELRQANRTAYDLSVVHCMTPFRDQENREKILDLIDAYIDVREALEENPQV